MKNDYLCITCAEVLSAEDYLAIETSNAPGCPSCKGWRFRPLVDFAALPKAGSAFYGRGLAVDATQVTLNKLLATLDQIVARGFLMDLKFIGQWDFYVITSHPRWPVEKKAMKDLSRV